jgi:hypothetical protein
VDRTVGNTLKREALDKFLQETMADDPYLKEFYHPDTNTKGFEFDTFDPTKPKWAGTQPGTGTYQPPKGPRRFRVQVPIDAADWVYAEEFRHFREAVRRYGVNGAEEYQRFIESGGRALDAVVETGNDAEKLAAWAAKDAKNVESLNNAWRQLAEEADVKGWLKNESGLQARYKPEQWQKVLEQIKNSELGYTKQREVIESAIKLLK